MAEIAVNMVRTFGCDGGEWTALLHGGPADGSEMKQAVPWPAIRLLNGGEYCRVAFDAGEMTSIYEWIGTDATS